MVGDFFALEELLNAAIRGAVLAGTGTAAVAVVFAGRLEVRAVAGLFEVLLTKAKTGMGKDLKLVPAALTVR